MLRIGSCPFLSCPSRTSLSRSNSRCKKRNVTQAVLANLATPEFVFNVASVSVMPFYFLMITFPRTRITKTVMKSLNLTFVFGALYAAVLVPNIMNGILGKILAVIRSSWPSPNIQGFSSVLMEPQAVLLTWLNLIVLDFYQARVLFLDGLRSNVWTGHSLLLCFMFGPLGFISHVITRRITSIMRRRAKT